MEAGRPGRIEQLSPLVRRILAPNPSPFTFTGTQTHIVGRGEVAIIDPGPAIDSHLDALLEGITGEVVAAILVTHTHRDHSPASRPLQERTGAPIIGCSPLAIADDGPRADDSFDHDYRPDRILSDGDVVEGEGWTIEAVATPGHTSNHLCFALPEERALFSGDHVMGWSTSIVSPPDGNMTDYLASLEKVRRRDDAIYYPAHGDPVFEPAALVERLIAHRRTRERQIIGDLRQGSTSIGDMVERIYADVDPRLHPAAARSVLAHLLDLKGRGLVAEAGERWELAS